MLPAGLSMGEPKPDIVLMLSGLSFEARIFGVPGIVEILLPLTLVPPEELLDELLAMMLSFFSLPSALGCGFIGSRARTDADDRRDSGAA